MDTLGIGHLINSAQERDAIHVAVAPVRALNDVRSGSWLYFPIEGNTEYVCEAIRKEGAIGIADPFLESPRIIRAEQQFWMFLIPGTITSLRHDWTHRAFAAAAQPPQDAQAVSRAWITTWADQYAVTYSEVIDRAKSWIEHGDYFSRGGQFEGVGVPDEFWVHFERATGIAVESDNRRSFFTCSC